VPKENQAEPRQHQKLNPKGAKEQENHAKEASKIQPKGSQRARKAFKIMFFFLKMTLKPTTNGRVFDSYCLVHLLFSMGESMV